MDNIETNAISLDKWNFQVPGTSWGKKLGKLSLKAKTYGCVMLI